MVRPFYANTLIPSSLRQLQSFIHPLPLFLVGSCYPLSGRPSTSIHKLEYVDSCSGMFLLCSKVPLYHSTENPIVVEHDDICTGEAYALTRATNGESELYNFGSREQLKKHAYLSTLLLTKLLIARLLPAPLYHGPKRTHSRETITEQRSWLLNTL